MAGQSTTLAVEKVVLNGDPSKPVGVEVLEYRGELFLDIRQYFTPDGATIPVRTKKGVRIPLAQKSMLMQVVDRVVAEAEIS